MINKDCSVNSKYDSGHRRQPSAVSRLLSTVCYLLSTVFIGLKNTILARRSTVRRPLSAVCRPLSAVRRLLSTVYCLLILLLSCTEKPPTTLRIALAVFPETFDYMKSTNRFSTIIESNIFETLIWVDYASQLHNQLIDYHYFQNDTLLVMHYKQGIQFSDGTYMTGIDIIESVTRYQSTMIDPSEFRFANIEDMGEYTLYFHLYKEDLDFFDIDYFTLVPVYKADNIRNFNDEQLGKNPEGTGPYYLYSFEQNKIVLRKNRYYREFAQMVENPDIVEYYYEPDYHSQYQMLKNHEVDFIMNMDYADYPEANTNPDIKIYKQLTDYFSYLAFDIVSPTRPDINLPTNPLRDRRVRQAIAHSVDMRSYIAENLSGQAILLTLPAPVQTINYPVALEYYEYNLLKARTLLREAGVPHGFKMKLASTMGVYSVWLSEFIKSSLKDINITVDIEFYEGIELYKALSQSPPSSYIVIFSPVAGYQELQHYIRGHLDFDEDHISKNNYLKTSNSSLHAILDTLKSLETDHLDPREKSRLNEKLISLVYNEVMVLPLFQPYTFSAMRHNIIWQTKKNNIPMIREFKVR